MNRKNRWFAAIMAMFFGTFGVHKLYLGRIGGFIMYFFLFTFSISFFRLPFSFILGLIDSFKIMSMSDEEFDEKYNKGIPAGIPKGRLEKRRGEQMEKYNKPVQRSPRSINQRSKINDLKNKALKKYKVFDLQDAIDDFNQILSMDPKDSGTHFNLACAYSLTEQKEKAFDHLSKAVQFGMNDIQKIMTHDDLAFVRIQPEFEKLKSSGFRYSMENQNDDKPDALLHQLQKLSELRNRGVLSEEEFHMERKKVLRQ